MSSRLAKLDLRIERLKKEIAALGPFRPGSLSQQHRKYKGEYGEYWQLSYTFKGRGRTKYVRTELKDTVAREIATYKKFKQLIDELIEMSIERSELYLAEYE